MKTLRTIIIAIVIAFGSTVMLTGCFVDADEEIYGQLETGSNNDGSSQETNDDQWD